MLRVTINETLGSFTLKLEGKLVGPWVQEARNCWQRVLASDTKSVHRVDLTGVTMIDQAGKSFLAAAHAQGAKLEACGCLIRAIVADITIARIPNADVENAMPQSTK